MFQKTYKYISLLVITLILVGHHSFQVQAMETSHDHLQETLCVHYDCHHEMKREICEKMKENEIHISSDFLVLLGTSKSLPPLTLEREFLPDEIFETYREHVPISQRQLARSHL